MGSLFRQGGYTGPDRKATLGPGRLHWVHTYPHPPFSCIHICYRAYMSHEPSRAYMFCHPVLHWVRLACSLAYCTEVWLERTRPFALLRHLLACHALLKRTFGVSCSVSSQAATQSPTFFFSH